MEKILQIKIDGNVTRTFTVWKQAHCNLE